MVLARLVRHGVSSLTERCDMNMEADAVEAKVVEKPFPPKKSNAWIWIVVAVLAFFVFLGVLVLVAFVVWAMPRGLSSAKIKAAQNQISQFKTPLMIYEMDIGSLPDNNQGLQVLRVVPSDLADPSKWQGPYLSREISLDPWGNEFVYEWLAPKEYRIYSGGPDGQPGTDDDIIEEVRDDGF